VPNTTRLRALALFSRRSPQRVVRLSLPAAENLHMSGCGEKMLPPQRQCHRNRRGRPGVVAPVPLNPMGGCQSIKTGDSKGPMPHRFFISYRRDDSAGHAGRISDQLGREFGLDALFMDVDAIPLGVNFIEVLREEVARCDVLLALIGPNWLNIHDQEGNRRLDNPSDLVRIEIATALRRNIPVIPVLLDGARMPKADQLPKDLEELAVRNGLDVRHTSFRTDVDKLIRALSMQPQIFDSPDGALRALIFAPNASPNAESRVVIRSSSAGDTITSEDYSSKDGEHGYCVYRAKWSPDSQFFVYSMTSSGGHSPWQFPMMVFGRKSSLIARFGKMIDNKPTLSGEFSFSGPHSVTATTWRQAGEIFGGVP
jgi:hypothetical protein